MVSMKSIGVFFGGQSAEHDISIVTAIASVIKPLEAMSAYRVIPVYIAKNGAWYSDQKLKDIKLYQTGEIDSFLKKSRPISVRFDNGLVLKQTKGLLRKAPETRLDIAFPAMHGTHGEDGELMGVFELAGIPYVGCELLASAIAMDKVVCKKIIEAYDIPTPKMISFSKQEYQENATRYEKDIADKLQLPLFVKPARLGSSIGITKVSSHKDLQGAIEVALHFDTKVLIEESVNNLIEVTVPIMGNHDLTPALVEQPIVSAEGSFDFETKYLKRNKKTGGAKSAQKGAQGYSKLPAEIPKKLYDSSIETACAAYKAIGCSGIARVDLLIDEKQQKVYFNELNPLPGSLYRHNWHAAGVSATELVTRLIDLAQQRHREKTAVNTSFKTNFLKQF